MPRIAIAVRPAGLTVLPCRFVTLAGETFALHRQIEQNHWGEGSIRPPLALGKRWTVSDPETGTHIGHGATQVEAVASAAATLAKYGAEVLKRQREGLLLTQWGLM